MIDLHVHSTASDGSFSPDKVVELAHNAGLRYFALTDHDTVDGVAQALNKAKEYNDLDVIPGIELSCYYIRREIHIVGLYVDYKDEHFLYELKKLKQAREERNRKMVKNFVDAGIPLTMEELLHGNPNSVITRAHFARVLVEKGICKTKNEAFDKYLGIDCPFYLPKPKVTIEHVMKLIIEAGGTPILAHPYSYKFDRNEVNTLLDTLIPLGLGGMECYYSTYDNGQIQELRSIALSKNLLVSGGSDFHGAVKPDISIGTGRNNLCIPDKLLEKIWEYRETNKLSNH
ncbi:MAG: PHP domain-containing protein [Lachnospiraceae bacterium]